MIGIAWPPPPHNPFDRTPHRIMRERSRILILLIFIYAAGVYSAEVLTTKQRLSRAWQLADEEFYEKAADEIRASGTNALPIFISMLQVKEPPNRRTNSGRAIFGYRALGPMAKPAIPELIALLGSKDFAGNAVVALEGIGPDAVPPLTASLTNDNPQIRKAAASGLGRLWKHAGSAAPYRR